MTTPERQPESVMVRSKKFNLCNIFEKFAFEDQLKEIETRDCRLYGPWQKPQIVGSSPEANMTSQNVVSAIEEIGRCQVEVIIQDYYYGRAQLNEAYRSVGYTDCGRAALQLLSNSQLYCPDWIKSDLVTSQGDDFQLSHKVQRASCRTLEADGGRENIMITLFVKLKMAEGMEGDTRSFLVRIRSIPDSVPVGGETAFFEQTFKDDLRRVAVKIRRAFNGVIVHLAFGQKHRID